MNSTPTSNRKHITLFGKTNSGKSSLFNSILNQNISIVSDISGTTTDSVSKAMELLPLGPVLFIDTAGLGDTSLLGEQRIKKTISELNRTDFALYIIDGINFLKNTSIENNIDLELYNEQKILFKKYRIDHFLIINKSDLLNNEERESLSSFFESPIFTSIQEPDSLFSLKKKIVTKLQDKVNEPSLIKDFLNYGDTLVMVVPIDSEAPKGRLILPQVQLLRDCLDSGIKVHVLRDTELQEGIQELKNINLVVTDSQAFKQVNQIINGRFPLTSFSILFANQKGDLKEFINGVNTIKTLKENSKILIAETCTHNTSHEDIGRYKIPALLQKKTGKNFYFTFFSGKDFPENLEEFDLIIHCGGCMITRKAMMNRINQSKEKTTPITNYGIVLAYLNDILNNSYSALHIK